MRPSKDILLVYPRCGKYDLFIVDMPLGLLYIARLLEQDGYRVHIFDERVEERGDTRLRELLSLNPLWVGFSIMTGEPIRHALRLAKIARMNTDAPLVWGGIHPTILPEQTLANELVDFIIMGKGERGALAFTQYLIGQTALEDVPGLGWCKGSEVMINPEDREGDWKEMPLVNYELIPVEKYGRVGFKKNIFSILTSRNCPYKCTFCYNSSLKESKPWLPDSEDYVKRHIAYILKRYNPDYLSFIDDDFFVDIKRARNILEFLAEIMRPDLLVGFRGARISDLLRLTPDFFKLMERINTIHINIGIESGSKRILKIIKKGMTPTMAVKANRILAQYSFTPLYNFFSGIPQETAEDIKMSTDLVLQLLRDNPNCQISGYHQYTPFPGNALFEEAVKSGFRPPTTLNEWGSRRFEDNASNCPWIDSERRKLLDMIYSMIYFVDSKYDNYIAGHKWYLKILQPFVRAYKPIARFRLRHHFTALPIEVACNKLLYKLMGQE